MTVRTPRLWVALACYATSGVGLLFMTVALDVAVRRLGTGSSPGTRVFDTACLLLWPAAWLALTLLALAWIVDRRVSRPWTALTVLVAVAALLVLPVANLAGGGDVRADAGAAPLVLAGSLLIQAVPVLPALALAVKVVRFHWRERTGK